MFEDLLEACGRLGETGAPTEVPVELSKHLPTKYNLGDILHVIYDQEKGDTKSLRALQVCLKGSGLHLGERDDSEASKELSQYIGRSILPTASGSVTATRWKSTAFNGELGIGVLETLHNSSKVSTNMEVLLAVAAYTNTQDPWTSSAAAVKAESVLAEQLSTSERKTSFITTTILSTFLRPLFSKSRPATVTASGRKAEFVEDVRYGGSFNDPSEVEMKPWKHAQAYAIAIFEWAVFNSGHEMLSKHWHLYTPVLLTLLDEPETNMKVRTMHIFSAFWERCPAGQMAKVGLAEIFEQAVFPAVLYLPTLTPEDESIRILEAAYPALFQIAGLPYPEERIGEPVQKSDFTEAQRKLLDKIFRQAILVGHRHANEHIRLTELFCQKTAFLVNGMGILAVKHLKDLIPMTSDIMTDPFGTNYPPTLLAAAELLQAIMRCCWPRMISYSNEIIRTLTVCFLNIDDEDSFPGGETRRKEVQLALLQTTEILSVVMKAHDVSLSDIVAPLVQKEPVLDALFTPSRIQSGYVRS